MNDLDLEPVCIVTVEPAVEPLLLADAKLFLRVDDTAEDVLIERLIKTARRTVEDESGRALITQTRKLYLRRFPGCTIRLPNPPLKTAPTIDYTDADGNAQQLTFAAGDYQVDIASSPGRVEPAYGSSWPSTRDIPNAVAVTFTCGYGDAGSAVDERAIHAIEIMLAAWFADRENGEIPPAALRLCRLLEVW
ncbi:MAG TPA: phage head-tail connector protein [Phycisphaerae bacterium]|nr:phage head-tail connector protein [Phycisphaerae bacterium]